MNFYLCDIKRHGNQRLAESFPFNTFHNYALISLFDKPKLADYGDMI